MGDKNAGEESKVAEFQHYQNTIIMCGFQVAKRKNNMFL